MRAMSRWIAFSLLVNLGGCFVAYDYEPSAKNDVVGLVTDSGLDDVSPDCDFSVCGKTFD